jgi:hypothetical protein
MPENYKIMKNAKGQLVVAGYTGTFNGRATYMVMDEIKNKAEGMSKIRQYSGSEAAMKREILNCKF